MNPKHKRIRITQLIVVLACAAALKFYYSTASVDDLRWILAPTTFLVEFVTGASFEFESNAGYMSSDHTFLIAASCSGVNFLITAFLMLSIGNLYRDRSHNIRWRFIPVSIMIAYFTTIIANTVRIATAMQMHSLNPETIWVNPDQLHRFEGIFIYFAFLLMLFFLSERLCSDKASNSQNRPRMLRRSLLPLIVYYATTLGVPLANGAYHKGADFWEHSVFVLVTPVALILVLNTLRLIGAEVQKPHGVRAFLPMRKPARSKDVL